MGKLYFGTRPLGDKIRGIKDKDIAGTANYIDFDNRKLSWYVTVKPFTGSVNYTPAPFIHIFYGQKEQ